LNFLISRLGSSGGNIKIDENQFKKRENSGGEGSNDSDRARRETRGREDLLEPFLLQAKRRFSRR